MRRFRFLSWTAVLLMGLALAAPRVQAQDAAAGAFARNGFDARGMAMGNALIADLSGNASPYYNPALAPYTTNQHLSASAAFMSMDRELQFLQFATPIQPSAGAALGIIHAGVTNIDGRNSDGYHTEDLSTDEFGLFLAFGNRFGERLSAGASLKLYRAEYLDTVDPVLTFGLDLGLTYEVMEQFQLGLVVSDLLANYNWNTSTGFGGSGGSVTDRFPVRVRLGGSYSLMDGKAQLVAEYESRFTALEEQRFAAGVSSSGAPGRALQTESYLVHGSRFRIGGAYRPVDILSLRAGINRIGVGDAAGIRPSAGFSVRETVGELNVEAEYAFVLESYVRDDMHLLTLKLFL